MLLGQAHQRMPCAIPVRRTAHDEYRTPAFAQRLRQRLQRRGIGRDAPRNLPRGKTLGRRIPVIDGHRNEGGTAGRLHGQVVGPRDRRGHILGPRGLAAPLHVRLGQLGGLGREQERLHLQQRARLLPGRDDQRRAIAVGGEDVAHGVPHADGRMQVHQRRIACSLRVTVRHAHDDRFLQAQHI